MSKILPRIKQLALNEGITIGALERIIGASKGVLSRAIANGTDIQTKWLEAIVENYPQYSAQWLLTGTGDMLKSNRITRATPGDQMPVVSRKDTDNSTINQIDDADILSTRPRIPMDAAAGSLSIALNGVTASECERLPVIPTFPKYDFTITARGDSMMPDFISGDELACTFVQESRFIQWGRPHVLDTAQGVVLKRIFDQAVSILCRSINPAYPDFEIPKSEIYHMALVVGLIRHL